MSEGIHYFLTSSNVFQALIEGKYILGDNVKLSIWFQGLHK